MAGTIVHFELPADDDSRAVEFYRSLFGWPFNTAEMPGLSYHMTEGVEPVGAVYRRQGGERGPVVYFATEDIDASVAQVRELGGEADEKQPIPEIGWFARCRDTEGNEFSLFQPDDSVPGPG